MLSSNNCNSRSESTLKTPSPSLGKSLAQTKEVNVRGVKDAKEETSTMIAQ